MTLTTHIAIATAVTKPIMRAHPFFIFLFAFLSHYAADAIPHWDYHLCSVNEDTSEKRDHTLKNDPKLIGYDLLKVAFDITIGSTLSFILLRPELTFAGLLPVALTILGGILPDMLQPIFWLWKKNNPFTLLKKFHNFMHSNLILRKEYVGPKLVLAGKIFQVFILGCALFFASL